MIIIAVLYIYVILYVFSHSGTIVVRLRTSLRGEVGIYEFSNCVGEPAKVVDKMKRELKDPEVQ